MRGAFVACFGERVDTELLQRVADAHQWHHGVAEQHAYGQLHVALLSDPADGPTFAANAGTALLIHGARLDSLSDLERRGNRFAAVECSKGQLKASRDPMGLCPLFYRVVGGVLWLSTEVLPLVALAPTSTDLAALTAQLALVPQESHTGWTEIFRLLPGHRLHASVDMRVAQHSYWDPARLISAFKGNPRDAEEELQARLMAAVDRCLHGPSGVLLSGGLDSAAIALSTSGRYPRLVHVTFPQSSDASEERYARAIANALETPLHVVSGNLSPWHPEQDLSVSVVPYMSPPQLTADQGLACLAEHGVRTALDGNDGDGVLGYVGREWGELVLTGRLGRLAELARAYGIAPVLYGVIDDFVPPALRFRGPRGKPPRPMSYLQRIERYFQEPLRSRMRRVDHERWRAPREEWRSRQLRQVVPVTTIRMEEHELRGARHDLDMRHPFADRELVEFLISLPVSLKSDPFRSKALLRSALSGRGPEEVIDRPDKPLYFDILGSRVSPELCLEVIRDSGLELPLVDYGRLYADVASADGVPLVLLISLARAHAFAAANT